MKNDLRMREISYFPGCSLATSAHENNQSMLMFCEAKGVKLVELDDWNCCGSSSTHRINPRLGHYLPARNLTLAPQGRPLLAACPSCFLRLKLSHIHIKEDVQAADEYRAMWGRPFDPGLEIISFFDLLSDLVDAGAFEGSLKRLNGLKFVPYYGCMLMRPPVMNNERNFQGLMEKVLVALGAQLLQWSHASRCCGTFLSVSRPDVATASVERIMRGAESVGAECMVTACAMCHLNLEIRGRVPGKIPVLHFSELLSLSMGIGTGGISPRMGWLRRHLTDPRPRLRERGIIA